MSPVSVLSSVLKSEDKVSSLEEGFADITRETFIQVLDSITEYTLLQSRVFPGVVSFNEFNNLTSVPFRGFESRPD